jgi:hypothetical protein
MLWTISAVLIILWMSGLGTDLAMGSFIHVLYVAAVALLVVSLSQEVTNNRILRRVSHSRGPKQDRNRRRERLRDQPAPSQVPRHFGQVSGSIS